MGHLLASIVLRHHPRQSGRGRQAERTELAGYGPLRHPGMEGRYGSGAAAEEAQGTGAVKHGGEPGRCRHRYGRKIRPWPLGARAGRVLKEGPHEGGSVRAARPVLWRRAAPGSQERQAPPGVRAVTGCTAREEAPPRYLARLRILPYWHSPSFAIA